MIHSGEKQDGGKHTPVWQRNAAFATHIHTQTHVIYKFHFFRQNFLHPSLLFIHKK